MPLYAFSRATAVIAVVFAGAAGAQEPPLPSKYFFPDSNAAMAAAFLDPHISNETKRALVELIEARRWPVEYQDPKTKLMWVYRPGMPPTLVAAPSSNPEARKTKGPEGVDGAPRPAHPRQEVDSARRLSRNE
jgi:hypothetical protein